MANKRPAVPLASKRMLIEEAGGKCANPGCPNRLVQIHHICEWHVYQTHNEKHMIAVCAGCHDAIHRGNLQITDEMLYTWKRMRRIDSHVHTNLWVEPGLRPQLWLGTFAFQSEGMVSVIKLSPHNYISFEIRGSDLLILDMRLTGKGGVPLIEIRNNTVTHEIHPDLYLETVPGQVMLVAPANTQVIPRWLVNRMRTISVRQHYPEDDQFILFNAAVIKPGVVSVSAILLDNDRAIIADQALHFVSRTHEAPIVFFAERKGETIFNIQGSIDWNVFGSIFGFADDPALYRLTKLDPRTGPVPYNSKED